MRRLQKDHPSGENYIPQLGPGNINMVEENDDVYVDEQIDLLEAWTFDLEHRPELEVEMDTDEKSFGDRAERDGPPIVREDELDQKATLEEISSSSSR